MIDQGMHLLDLSHWLLGPLPLHSALLRTQLLGHAGRRQRGRSSLGEARIAHAPWATLHVTWTEWKNLFSLEIYCRTAKLQVDGLVRSYGPQTLRIYRMKPELGPPDIEVVEYPTRTCRGRAEWEHFRGGARRRRAAARRPRRRALRLEHRRGGLRTPRVRGRCREGVG